MRRVGVIASLILIAVGLAFALVPFDRPLPRRSSTYGGNLAELSDRCAPPIVSAWRSETASGWFGYAPGEDPPEFPHVFCQPTAQRRLAYAGFFWFAAALLALATHLRRDRREPDPPAES